MAKTREKVVDATGTVKPYVERALRDEELRESVKLCPSNPLSVYTLGRVCLMEGNKQEARGLFQQAYKLYSQFVWVPAGARQSLTQVGARP